MQLPGMSRYQSSMPATCRCASGINVHAVHPPQLRLCLRVDQVERSRRSSQGSSSTIDQHVNRCRKRPFSSDTAFGLVQRINTWQHFAPRSRLVRCRPSRDRVGGTEAESRPPSQTSPSNTPREASPRTTTVPTSAPSSTSFRQLRRQRRRCFSRIIINPVHLIDRELR